MKHVRVWTSVRLGCAMAVAGSLIACGGAEQAPSVAQHVDRPGGHRRSDEGELLRCQPLRRTGQLRADTCADCRASKQGLREVDRRAVRAATSRIDPTPFQGFVDPTPDADWRRYHSAFPNLAVGAPDQLRLRVTWALSQFIVASDRKGDLVGSLYWINLLLQQSLGRYDDLLYQASINPHMGHYLDNDQNRPKSAECQHCAPNENFARELMQLFTLGVFKLNPDGSAKKDGLGRPARDLHPARRRGTGARAHRLGSRSSASQPAEPQLGQLGQADGAVGLATRT